MRNLFVFLLILFSVNNSFGQSEEVPNFRKSDILIDPFWLIGGLAVNANYERILSEDSGVGPMLFSVLEAIWTILYKFRLIKVLILVLSMHQVFILKDLFLLQSSKIKSGATTNSSKNTSAGLGFG